MKYEISILWSDSRYFWSVAFNILLRCFNVVTCKELPLHLTLTDFLQVPFIERTLMPVIRAEGKIAELEAMAANAQLTID